MFDTVNIAENKVCDLRGKCDLLRDILFEMELKNRKTVKYADLEEMFFNYNRQYEIAWNKWADMAHIGGKRYNEKGLGESRGDE